MEIKTNTVFSSPSPSFAGKHPFASATTLQIINIENLFVCGITLTPYTLKSKDNTTTCDICQDSKKRFNYTLKDCT
ncbi:hypothetical protein VTL71DRAFT_13333 [Oculimacula yallundae]|uniref:Uncharacterized protein n=1 Tax=Oculimacula yallundae TaxID=86028 RepID=A0ABR4CLC2_9HELO